MATTLCHSVRLWGLPSLSFHRSTVATDRLTTHDGVGRVAHFGVDAEAADEEDLVDHGSSPPPGSAQRPNASRALAQFSMRLLAFFLSIVAKEGLPCFLPSHRTARSHSLKRARSMPASRIRASIFLCMGDPAISIAPEPSPRFPVAEDVTAGLSRLAAAASSAGSPSGGAVPPQAAGSGLRRSCAVGRGASVRRRSRVRFLISRRAVRLAAFPGRPFVVRVGVVAVRGDVEEPEEEIFLSAGEGPAHALFALVEAVAYPGAGYPLVGVVGVHPGEYDVEDGEVEAVATFGPVFEDALRDEAGDKEKPVGIHRLPERAQYPGRGYGPDP